jgi:predicted nucleotidyltransferase
VQDYFKDKPVKKIFLFGSYAKGNATENSDVDFAFEMPDNARVSYWSLATYLIDLEKRLNKKVDLVEDKLIYPKLKKEIDTNKLLILSK